MAKLHSWIDLSAHDKRLRLLAMQMNSGKTVLLLIGGEHFPDAVEELGFTQSSQGFFYRSNTSLQKASVAILRKHFPGLTVKEMEASDITVKSQRAREIMLEISRTNAEEQADVDPVVNASLSDDELLQTDYKSKSELGGADVKIPRNLEMATQKALAKMAKNVGGDVDQFVADAMNKTVDELSESLDAEQIDAVALALDAFDRQRGFILGDATGLGKGRTISSVALSAILQGKPVVFMTEKANLISDIYRDLKAIGALTDVNMLTLNPLIKVVDAEGEIAYQANRKEIKSIAAAREISDEYNFIAGTYSQIRTMSPPTDPQTDPASRIELLEKKCKGALLILDEADVASGSSSNTYVNVNRLIDAADDVMFSSATAIREAKAIALFNRAFPVGMGSRVIAKNLSESGQAAQEALSEQLCADGVMLVREHDYNGMTVDMVEDKPRLSRNEELADKLSEILSAIHFLSGDVGGMVDQRNKDLMKKLEKAEASRSANSTGKPYNAKSVTYKHGKLASSYTHFGSKLYNLNRQFLLGLNVDAAVEMAHQAIVEDKKPIIVLDKTMGSLLESALKKDDDTEDEDDNSLFESMFEEEEDIMPTFKDILTKTLESSCHIRTVYRGQVRKVNIAEENESVRLARDAIQELVDKFPDVDVTPIDSIIHKLRELGHEGGEITGRGLHIVEDELGLKRIEKRPEPDRNHLLRQFNNASAKDGGLDYLIINKAAASGASMHAGVTVKDQRPRTMIFAQTPDTANSMKQFLGRTWRKDLVEGHIPEYKVLSGGLPIETYYNAAMDRKLRELSSCTTSNRDNGMVSDAPDLFNAYGNEVMKDYLLENDHVAEQLRIEVKEDDERFDPTNYVRLVLSRLQLMRISDQKTVLADIKRLFDQGLDELAMIGINPLKTSHYDWKAKEVRRELFRGDEAPSETVFDEPIYIKEIEYEETIYPLKSNEVLKMMRKGSQSLGDSKKTGNDSTLEVLTHHLEENRVSIASRLLREGQLNLQDALDSDVKSPAKRSYENMTKLIDVLMDVAPGKVVKLSDIMGIQKPGVVVNVTFSGQGFKRKKNVFASSDWFSNDLPGVDFSRLSNYSIVVATQGDQRAFSYSLSSLLSDVNFETTGEDYTELAGDLFDSIENGNRVVTKTILEGNIYQASQMAKQLGSVVTYTDDEGHNRRGVLLKNLVNQTDLDWLPQPMRDPKAVTDALTHAAQTPRVITNKKKGTSRDAYDRIWADNGEKYKSKALHAQAEYKEDQGKVIYTIDFPKYKLKDTVKYNADQEVIKYVAQEVERLKLTQVDDEELPTTVKKADSRTMGHIHTDDPTIFRNCLSMIQKNGETFYIRPAVYRAYQENLRAGSDPAMSLVEVEDIDEEAIDSTPISAGLGSQ